MFFAHNYCQRLSNYLVPIVSFGIISSPVVAEDTTKTPQSSGAKGASTFSGNASWYGVPFHGKKTASGEIFDMNKLSAAHLHLPLISKVLVENPRTGESTVVRVNDRGPYHTKRVMDLSREAAKRVGIFPRGVGLIECTVINNKSTSKAEKGSTQ